MLKNILLVTALGIAFIALIKVDMMAMDKAYQKGITDCQQATSNVLLKDMEDGEIMINDRVFVEKTEAEE